MAAHIVRSFGQELERLTGDVARMGGLAEYLVSAAIDASVRRDLSLAKEVMARDAEVDELQTQLERDVMRLLALRQPLAQDLRQAIAALKISVSLERVGDLAKNIAKRSVALSRFDPVEPMNNVDRMGRLVAGQLHDVLDAYSRKDWRIARAVWSSDNEVDDHHNALFLELVTFMSQDAKMVGPGAHLLFMAKNLERIGDHATNIAEVVHYLATGEDLGPSRPKSDILGGVGGPKGGAPA